MSGTKNKPAAEAVTEQAREDLEKAGSGDTTGVTHLDKAHKSDPVEVEAVEQEASDGPEGRGLAR